jgi:hypothetical protein
MASYYNLFVDQGADFSTFITIQGSDLSPLDLTNVNLKGQIRKSYGSSTAYDFVIVKTDVTAGQIQIKITADISESLAPGRYVYDVYAEDTVADTRFKVIEGILEIVPSVTKYPT